MTWANIVSIITIFSPFVLTVAVLISVLSLRSLVDQQRVLAGELFKLRTEIIELRGQISTLSRDRREGA